MTAEPVVFAPDGWPRLPERTLAPVVVDWAEKHLVQPDGPNAGQPWRFTDTQLRFLAYWFAYDETERWLYRRGTVRLCKGAGKDPLVAVLALNELLGPARIVAGKPSRASAPWVQIAAVSREQTRTTMRLFPGLLPKRTLTRYGIEVNKEIVYALGGRGVIESVTSSPASLEGGRATFVVRNEIQEWKSSNEGHAMAEVIDGNLAKSRDGAARALSVCNAHVPGEDSVAEREWDAWQAISTGRTRKADVFYLAVEAPPETKLDDEDSLRAGLTAARHDAVWLDVDRLIAEIWDPRTTPSEARRKYLNQVVAAEDAWVAPHAWDACKVAATLDDRDVVTLGFDGSSTDDHSALVATRVSDGTQFVLGVWDPERFGGEAPREEIDAAVQRAFDRFDVVAFYSDVHPFESYVDKWGSERPIDRRSGLCVAGSQRNPVAWDMRAKRREFTLAAERFLDAVVSGRYRHDGDLRLREHALNARRRPDRYGLSFSKEHRESSRKVDALAAAVLSRQAYTDYTTLPPSKQRRKTTGAAQFA